MPFDVNDLVQATKSLERFRIGAKSPHHERYAFPFFCGTYFSYRKIDVLRVAAVAKSVSPMPAVIDIGCGYGDFLHKLREFVPHAEGLEADGAIFYSIGMQKPDYIKTGDARFISSRYDCAFVGWMEPGQDYRDRVAAISDVIVTTLDQGISLAAEFDGHGFELVASWRTPSWEDVNVEIMNRHYSPGLSDQGKTSLAKMRGAHNLWYVYCKPNLTNSVRSALSTALENEDRAGCYEFEHVLDECGFSSLEKLDSCAEPLWQIQFKS